MKLKILNTREKKEIEEKIGKKIEGMVLKIGKDIRIYTGNLTRDELLEICKNVDVFRIGLKFDANNLLFND